MKIQYCSDLHLEFKANTRYVMDIGLKPVGDVLVMAGDITIFEDRFKEHAFFDYVSDNFSRSYLLPGNHEYYGGHALTAGSSLKEKIRSNIYLVNNVSVEEDSINLVFSTLWSRIGPEFGWYIQSNVSDFAYIRCGGERLTTERYNTLHERDLAFLTETVEKLRGRKNVVVTHHVPTFRCQHEDHRGSRLSEAFVVELEDLIATSDVLCWIYGHNHRNMPDVEIDGTRVVTNQLGYVEYGESEGFRRDAYIEL
ncbi:MAG: metallophosphoesterase [Proteobacteria bacterium]|nr:metallophosphoesterase [Pseudomonadota bacterium]